MWQPEILPDEKETILILAGDLWLGTKFIEYGNFSWIEIMSERFKEVLIVLGNHDYWPQGGLTIENAAYRCNCLLVDRGLNNVIVLDRDSFEIDDILFVGCTLWTDMNKCDPLTMYNMPLHMAYDGKITYETGPNGYYKKFTSQKWISTFYLHRDYLKLIVEKNKDKKIVVITHHIPVTHIYDPMYENDPSNGYYMSDLSDFILDNPHIKLWCYGHTHFTSDEILGSTRLYNNSVGYQGEHKEQQKLVKHEVLEL